MRSYVARCTEDALSMSPVSMTCLLSFTMLGLCAATSRCGCSGVHGIGHLQTNGLRDVGARGHGIAIAQKMSFVLDQVVENQRSVKRTARRDHTPSFFLFADFFKEDSCRSHHEAVRLTRILRECAAVAASSCW